MILLNICVSITLRFGLFFNSLELLGFIPPPFGHRFLDRLDAADGEVAGVGPKGVPKGVLASSRSKSISASSNERFFKK